MELPVKQKENLCIWEYFPSMPEWLTEKLELAKRVFTCWDRVKNQDEVRQPERVPGIISVRPDTSDTAVMPHSFPELAAS